jgi:hypothetical protein
MDILKSLSIIGLLTMVIYFIMVNLWDNHAVPTQNVITAVENPSGPLGVTGEGIISNKLQINPEQSKSKSICSNFLPPNSLPSAPSWVDRNLQGEPYHAVTVVGDPIESNASLFDRTADFGSDVTNINQFYKNNPELFNRVTNVNISPTWDNQKTQLLSAETIKNHTVEGYNYEQSYASPL